MWKFLSKFEYEFENAKRVTSQKRASPKVSRAFDSRVDVFCDCALQKIPGILPGRSQFCAFSDSAKLQEPLGRERSVGSDAPLGGVYLVYPWAATADRQTADLRLETQSMFWLLHPGAVICTQANVLDNGRTMNGVKEADTEFWQIFVGDRPVRIEGHTYTYESTIENRVLLRYDSDGQN